MKTYEQNTNMEFGEQVLRGGVGAIMLGVGLFLPGVTSTELAGLSMAALYMVFTGIMAWDPIYALFGRFIPQIEPTKASVTQLPRREAPVSHDHKKAA